VDPVDGGADDNTNWPKTVSSATYVEDVNQDPIIIVNGLTKNWRLPGFRLCWIVGPKKICEMLSSAGSFLDGGANAPLQKLALPLMDMDFIRRDTWALQRHFKMKRDFLLRELANLGITVQWQPTATFYVWANLSALPHPLGELFHQFSCLTYCDFFNLTFFTCSRYPFEDDCLVFLEECVKHKVSLSPLQLI
jgi:aspartate/methionine/tyrosine aminotransferase